MKKIVVVSVIAMLLIAASYGPAQVQPAAPKAPAAVTTLSVETKLGTSIENRMPMGEATAFAAEVGSICLWCKVTGATGETTIKHVWYHQGKELATVELAVRSSPWRTWSFKTIPAHLTGDWTVKVLDQGGNVLKEVSFTVGGAAETPKK
jgi:hypothetical protein